MRRIATLAVAATVLGCSGSDPVSTGDLTVNLGTLPAVVATYADSAFVRVRNTGLGVNEVRRIGLPATALTVTVAAGSGYEVTAVTLISGATKFAIGGGIVDNVSVEAGGTASSTVAMSVT